MGLDGDSTGGADMQGVVTTALTGASCVSVGLVVSGSGVVVVQVCDFKVDTMSGQELLHLSDDGVTVSLISLGEGKSRATEGGCNKDETNLVWKDV